MPKHLVDLTPFDSIRLHSTRLNSTRFNLSGILERAKWFPVSVVWPAVYDGWGSDAGWWLGNGFFSSFYCLSFKCRHMSSCANNSTLKTLQHDVQFQFQFQFQFQANCPWELLGNNGFKLSCNLAIFNTIYPFISIQRYIIFKQIHKILLCIMTICFCITNIIAVRQKINDIFSNIADFCFLMTGKFVMLKLCLFIGFNWKLKTLLNAFS